jgi:hypothetical protein
VKVFKFPFYVFLFALFPAISLMGINVGQANLDNLLRPLLFSLLLTSFVFLLSLLIIREINLAGIITLIIMFAFFSYGNIFTFLDAFRPFGIRLSRNSFISITYLVIIIVGILWVFRKRGSIAGLTPYMNILSLVILIYPLFQIINYSNSGTRIDTKEIESEGINLPEKLPSNYRKPDIYLILLDGYNREDILKSYFHYDNSKFISDLEKMDFTVADCSMTNYNQTRLTMASELNLNYMDTYFPLQEKLSYERTATKILSENAVRRLLENSGYHTYTFDDFYYPFLNWEHVEHLLSVDNSSPWSRDLTAFESMFLKSTVLTILTQYRPELVETMQNMNATKMTSTSNSAKNYLVNRTHYMLDTLPKLVNEKSPKFVYAHFTVTHPPFLFTSDGEIIDSKYRFPGDDAQFIEGYNNQVDYMNSRLLPVLQKIIDNSEEPPIIIVQSDHGIEKWIGSKANKPNQNLTALYLPGIADGPYSSISAVNIFRLVFNDYFELNLPYLEDRSYQLNEDDYSLTRVYDSEPDCK